MSCPDWPTLVARRDQVPEGELSWERALEHLDACASCREAAYAAEPTLVFRRLPTLEPSAEDVRAMQRSVAAMRRAQPIVEPRASGRRRRDRRFGWLGSAQLRAAATVAVVGAAVLLYALQVERGGPGVVGAADVKAVEVEAAGVEAAGVEAAGVPDGLPEALLAADAADGDLRFEIQVLRASSAGEVPSSLSFEDFQLLAQANVSSRGGEDVSTSLGDRFTLSFKAGEVLADGRLRLEDFQIETRAPAVKGRQLEPRQVVNANLNLWLGRPLTLVVAQDPGQQEALVVAITCRRQPAGR